MFNTIRSTIESFPEVTFEEFYQDYIRRVQDELLDYDVSKVESRYRRQHRDAVWFLHEINHLVEQLQRAE